MKKSQEIASAASEDVEDSDVKEFVSQLLLYFNTETFTSSKIDIIEFWSEKTAVYPLLKEVVIAILSIPGTQVSVERLFSAVPFILNQFRSNLLGVTLENILLLQNNLELFEQEDEICKAVIEGLKA